MRKVIIDWVTYVPEQKDYSRVDELKEEKYDEERFPKWSDLWDYRWYYLDSCSTLTPSSSTEGIDINKNSFSTKEQAEWMLAAAQLSQLMKRVNGDWTPDWDNREQHKCTIAHRGEDIVTNRSRAWARFLAFKDKESRDWFLGAYRPLIETYFKWWFS